MLSLSGFPRLGAQTLTIFGDDGLAFTGACCTPATLSLPTFPSFTLTGRYFGIRDCVGLVGTTDVNVVLSSPSSLGNPSSDLFTQTWTISAVSGGTSFTTIVLFARLKYTRTWMEVDSVGNLRQIWRFVVNLRLNFDDMDASPFPRPPCDDFGGAMSGFGGAWFTGFLDYASRPEGDPNGRDGVSFALSHEPGCLSHEPDPSFNNQYVPSTNTTERHESFSYHLVAPSSGFTDATAVTTLPSLGDIDLTGVSVESYRTLQTLLAPMLTQEIGVASVNVITAFRDCHCTPMAPGALSLYWHQNVGSSNGASFTSYTYCMSGTSLVAIPFSSAVGVSGAPPQGFYQHFIGQWSLPVGTWPEDRRVWTSGGLWDYEDYTSGYPPLQPNFHFVHGGTIRYPAGGAVIHLYSDTGSPPVDYHLVTDVANGLEYSAMPLSQTAQVGIETWAISSWQFNR